MNRCTPHNSSRAVADRQTFVRSAFTLLELLLALTVLVTLAALSLPNLMRTLKQQTVQGNAEQVRQVLDRARVRAVEEGRILQLRFEPHGRHYVLLPQEPVDESQSTGAAAPQTSTRFSSPVTTSEPFRVYEVSGDCHFHVDSSLLSGEQQVTERLGEEWAAHLQDPSGVTAISWSPPILYFPDGSATDGTLVVMDQDRRYLKLHVRGLTGAVWSEPLAVMEERLGRTGP